MLRSDGRPVHESETGSADEVRAYRKRCVALGYRILAAHQAGYYEFNTFGFGLLGFLPGRSPFQLPGAVLLVIDGLAESLVLGQVLIITAT